MRTIGKRGRRQRGAPPIVGFVCRFIAAWVTGLALLALAPSVERWAIHATIASLGIVARVLRVEWTVSGSDVGFAGAHLEIITDCTPIMPTLALWSAMFAFPAPLPWKLSGMAAVGGGLWVYNLARVLALAFVLRSRPSWFEFLHVYLWQSLTLLVVLTMFVCWVKLLRPDEMTS